LCNFGQLLGSNVCRDQIGVPSFLISGRDRVFSPRSRRAMLIGFANLKTALIVLLGVLVLFFFPAPRGSFVSTHGPITSLRTVFEYGVIWPTLVFSSLVIRKLAIQVARLGPSTSLFAAPILQAESPRFSVLRI